MTMNSLSSRSEGPIVIDLTGEEETQSSTTCATNCNRTIQLETETDREHGAQRRVIQSTRAKRDLPWQCTELYKRQLSVAVSSQSNQPNPSQLGSTTSIDSSYAGRKRSSSLGVMLEQDQNSKVSFPKEKMMKLDGTAVSMIASINDDRSHATESSLSPTEIAIITDTCKRLKTPPRDKCNRKRSATCQSQAEYEPKKKSLKEGVEPESVLLGALEVASNDTGHISSLGASDVVVPNPAASVCNDTEALAGEFCVEKSSGNLDSGGTSGCGTANHLEQDYGDHSTSGDEVGLAHAPVAHADAVLEVVQPSDESTPIADAEPCSLHRKQSVSRPSKLTAPSNFATSPLQRPTATKIPTKCSKLVSEPELDKIIEHPGKNDVICGNGFSQHSGNVQFHDYCSPVLEQYQNASSNEKHKISCMIFDKVWGQEPPGRFGHYTRSGEWVIVSERKAFEAICSVLRQDKRVQFGKLSVMGVARQAKSSTNAQSSLKQSISTCSDTTDSNSAASSSMLSNCAPERGDVQAAACPQMDLPYPHDELTEAVSSLSSYFAKQVVAAQVADWSQTNLPYPPHDERVEEVSLRSSNFADLISVQAVDCELPAHHEELPAAVSLLTSAFEDVVQVQAVDRPVRGDHHDESTEAVPQNDHLLDATDDVLVATVVSTSFNDRLSGVQSYTSLCRVILVYWLLQRFGFWLTMSFLIVFVTFL